MILEMKGIYPCISLSRLCRLLGITRQAYYQHFWEVSDITIGYQLILDRVIEIRQIHPAIGGRKLFYLLQSFLLEHQIKIGRDALFDLLAANKLLVRKLSLHHARTKRPLTKNHVPGSSGHACSSRQFLQKTRRCP